MSKILFYTMGLSKGGAERVISNLANTFIKEHDVVIVTNNKCKSEYKLNNIKHICIDEIKRNKIVSKLGKKRTKKLYQIIKKEDPDTIITFLPEPTIRILSLKKHLKDKKLIISIRNNPKYEFPLLLKYIRNYYYKFANVIVIQSDSYKKYLPNKLKNKCITIPNYIKDDFYNIPKVKKEKIIVSVGRLERQKNYKLLIKAFNSINQKYKDYKLYIYGEGKQKNTLQKYIKKLNLENKVILKGMKDNINNEINKGKLFVLTSKYEGMPNALLEAMSLSIPVITTNSSPVIPEIINEENGIIVKNKKQLIFTIDNLLKDEKKLEEIGNSGKEIINRFNENDILKKWYKLL